jgi:hypothetical protein
MIQQITCAICNSPVDLTLDRYTDESGQVVHETCYVNRVMSVAQDPPTPQHSE